ncbi:RNA polymerase sigma factor [Pedobacter sp. 22163]|uniref:RNA polymerase sigma factor n=1 Tax=Pedobacter sp. 22163 TaxID=3453883 RepID=UPI003F8561D5
MTSNKISLAIENHSAVLMAHAIKFTGNADDANDLVQDTFLKAFRFISSYTEGTNLSGWLFTIMKNTFLNKCNSMTSKKVTFVDHSDLSLLNQNESASNLAIGKIANDEIRRALSKIPGKLSGPFIMHFEGHTYRELAEEYAVPIGTIKTRIHTAKKLLKDMLFELRSYEVA